MIQLISKFRFAHFLLPYGARSPALVGEKLNSTLLRSNTVIRRSFFQLGSKETGEYSAAYSFQSNQDSLSNQTNYSFNVEMSEKSLENNFHQINELINDNSSNAKSEHKTNILHLKLSSIGNFLSLSMISEVLAKSDDLRAKFMLDIIEGLPENTSLMTRTRVHNCLSQIFLEVEFDNPEKWLWLIDLKKDHGVDFSRLLHIDQILSESFKTRHNVSCSFDKFLVTAKSKPVELEKEPVFLDMNTLLDRLNKILEFGTSCNFKFVLGGDSLIHPIMRRIALEAMRVHNKTSPQIFIEYSTHADLCYSGILRDIELCVRDDICYGLQLTHENSPQENSLLNFPLLNMSNFTEIINELLIKYREETLGRTNILIYTQNEIVMKYAMETMRIMQIDPESGFISFARQKDYSKKLARQLKKSHYPQILYELLGDSEAIANHTKELGGDQINVT